MANNLLAQLALNIAGGAAASYADRRYGAQYSQTIPGTDVKLSPGAIGALGGALLLAIGAPLPAKPLLAAMIGGALVYEGTKFAEDVLIPKLSGAPSVQTGVPAAPAAQQLNYASMGLPPAVPSYYRGVQAVAGRPVSQFEIDQALSRRQRAAA